MGYAIARPISGVSLNGNEYVLNDSGSLLLFETVCKAEEFLHSHGITDEEMEDFIFEEVKEA